MAVAARKPQEVSPEEAVEPVIRHQLVHRKDQPEEQAVQETTVVVVVAARPEQEVPRVLRQEAMAEAGPRIRSAERLSFTVAVVVVAV